MSHSLSWYRRGDRYPGSKLYARTWTPEDPRSHISHSVAHHLQQQTQAASALNHSSTNHSHQRYNSPNSCSSSSESSSLNEPTNAAAASTARSCHELYNEMQQQNGL